MNIIVSKEQFRCLTEALARKSVLSDTVFVSYGTDKFDKNSVKLFLFSTKQFYVFHNF